MKWVVLKVDELKNEVNYYELCLLKKFMKQDEWASIGIWAVLTRAELEWLDSWV